MWVLRGSGWSMYAWDVAILLEWRVRLVVYKLPLWVFSRYSGSGGASWEIEDEASFCCCLCSLSALYIWQGWLFSLWQNSRPQSYQSKKRRVSLSIFLLWLFWRVFDTLDVMVFNATVWSSTNTRSCASVFSIFKWNLLYFNAVPLVS